MTASNASHNVTQAPAAVRYSTAHWNYPLALEIVEQELDQLIVLYRKFQVYSPT